MTLLRISDVIEDRHATSLLACIFLRGRMPKTTLAQSVSNNPRMAVDVDFLEMLNPRIRADIWQNKSYGPDTEWVTVGLELKDL